MPAGKGITEPKKLSEDLADICGVEVLLIPELGKVFEMNFEYKNINHNCILLLIGG